MNFLDTVAVKAVDRYFRPPNAARAARRQAFALGGTVLLVAAAFQHDGSLAWALWLWIAYRVHVFVWLVVAGPRVADEVTRRLASLPIVLSGRVNR